MASGKRNDGENFRDYRKRLRKEEKETKIKMKGRPCWIGAYHGTYKRGDIIQ